MKQTSLIFITLIFIFQNCFTQEIEVNWVQGTCLTELRDYSTLNISNELLNIHIDNKVLERFSMKEKIELERQLSNKLSLSKIKKRQREKEKREYKFTYQIEEKVTNLINDIKNATTLKLKKNIFLHPIGIVNLAKILTKEKNIYRSEQLWLNNNDERGWIKASDDRVSSKSLAGPIYYYGNNPDQSMKEFNEFNELKNGNSLCGLSFVIKLSN